MSRDILRQLKNLKNGEVNPRENWVSENRSVLLSQIKNTVNQTAQKNFHPKNVWDGLSIFFSPNTVNFAMRPIGVLVIVSLIFLTTKIATVDAAYEALPGDILYPAKRAVEKTQVVVAQVMGDTKGETKLHSEFAKRRASETKRLMNSDDPQKNEKAVQTLTDLKQELQSVDTKLDTSNNQNSGVTAAVVQEVKQNTEEIKTTLTQVKNDLVANNADANSALTQQVSETKDAVNGTDLKAVTAIVTKHLQGDTTVSKDDVTQVINTTLNNVVTDAVSNKQDAEDAHQVVVAVKAEVSGLTKDPGVGVAVSTSTKELSDKINVMDSETKNATAQTDVIVKEVDKQVTEAKALLSNGNLAEAVDKVKEASESSQKVEDITDKTIASVQKVLPVMGVVVKENVDSAIVTSTANIVIVVTTTPALNTVTTTPAVLNVPTIKPSATIIVPSTTIKIIKPVIKPVIRKVLPVTTKE